MKKPLHNCTEASGLLLLLLCLVGLFLSYLLCLLPASLHPQLPGCTCGVPSYWQHRFGRACQLVACPSTMLQLVVVHY